MYNSFYKKYIITAICISLLYVFFSCENFLPNTFKSEKYDIAELDSTACKFLTGDLIVKQTIIENEDTTFVDQYRYKNINTSLLTTLIDSTAKDTDPETINTILNTLASSIDTLVTDTTLYVVSPAESDTSYALYNHNNEKGDIYCYISWKFTELNLDDFIEIDIIGKDAKLYTKKENVPIEAISGCSEPVIIEESGIDEVIPKIRTRVGFELESGLYLVRFIVSEPLEITSFRTVLLQQ